MHLRRVLPGDIDLLFLWRTDPDTVEASLTPPPTYAEHQRWFGKARLDPLCQIYIAETDTKPIEMIGMCRFNTSPETTTEAEVSITIAPEFRYKGWGSRLLRQASRKYLEEEKATVIYARVKRENTGSIRAFRKAGYRRLRETPELTYLGYYGE